MAININQTTDTQTPSTGILSIGSSHVAITTAGKGLQVKEGSNAKMGQAILNGSGSATVSTTAVTTNSRIFLSYANKGTAGPGLTEPLWVSSISNGASFVIKSGVSGSSNDSTVNWLIIEPA